MAQLTSMKKPEFIEENEEKMKQFIEENQSIAPKDFSIKETEIEPEIEQIQTQTQDVDSECEYDEFDEDCEFKEDLDDFDDEETIKYDPMPVNGYYQQIIPPEDYEPTHINSICGLTIEQQEPWKITCNESIEGGRDLL